MLPISKRISIILLLWVHPDISAQTDTSTFAHKWEPNLSYTRELSSRWSINGILAGLYNVHVTPSEFAGQPKLERLQVQVFGTYKVYWRQEVSLGYMYRIRAPSDDEPGYEHRFTEQYNIISYFDKYRLVHRIRQEQRIRDDGFENRSRYRLSCDLPLAGQRLDPGEIYVILSEELVFSYNIIYKNLENRFTGGFGWQMAEQQKIEIKAEHRFAGLRRDQALHFVTAFYLNY